MSESEKIVQLPVHRQHAAAFYLGAAIVGVLWLCSLAVATDGPLVSRPGPLACAGAR